MEGGIAIFLVLLIIFGVAAVSTGMFGLAGGAAAKKKADEDAAGDGPRPKHLRVEDESARTQDPDALPHR